MCFIGVYWCDASVVVYTLWADGLLSPLSFSLGCYMYTILNHVGGLTIFIVSLRTTAHGEYRNPLGPGPENTSRSMAGGESTCSGPCCCFPLEGRALLAGELNIATCAKHVDAAGPWASGSQILSGIYCLPSATPAL